MWDQWLSEMQAELADMKAFYDGFKIAKKQAGEERQE
jgi:hypothetical protein